MYSMVSVKYLKNCLFLTMCENLYTHVIVVTLNNEVCTNWSKVFQIAEVRGPLIVCCLNKTSCPIAYKSTGFLGNTHNIVVTIGAGFVAYPHCDTDYSDRVSVILNESYKVSGGFLYLMQLAHIFSLACVDLVHSTQWNCSHK
jgi:hypothetical protein